MVRTQQTWRNVINMVNNTKAGSSRRLLVEVHSGSAPSYGGCSYLAVRPDLISVRHSLHRVNVNMTVFTLVRDPVDWTLSAYNYYEARHNSNGDREHSYSHMLTFVGPNPQTDYLIHAQATFFSRDHGVKRASGNPTPEECALVVKTMLAPPTRGGMDWVGTTDDLGRTLEYLSQVGHVVPLPAADREGQAQQLGQGWHKNSGNDKFGAVWSPLRKEFMSSADVARLHQRSLCDSAMLAAARERFGPRNASGVATLRVNGSAVDPL